MNGLVSIIIPAYNAGSYIDHIFPCLLSQTYSNLEIILINDGSTDNTLEKCQRYEQTDCRIRVITQDHLGVSVARNRGLAEAQGDYVSFIDVDDLVRQDYIEVLYNAAIKDKCEVVCCACIQTEGNYGLIESGEYPTVLHDRLISQPKDVINDYCYSVEQYGCVVWAKLIKRDLATSHRFDNLRYGEDTLYMQNVLMDAQRIELLRYQGYYYIRWDKSVTLSTSPLEYKRSLENYLVKKNLLELCIKYNGKEFINKAESICAEQFVKLLRSLLLEDFATYQSQINCHAGEAMIIKNWENIETRFIIEIAFCFSCRRLYYYVAGHVYRKRHLLRSGEKY